MSNNYEIWRIISDAGDNYKKISQDEWERVEAVVDDGYRYQQKELSIDVDFEAFWVEVLIREARTGEYETRMRGILHFLEALEDEPPHDDSWGYQT